jgi:hypothetical protein
VALVMAGAAACSHTSSSTASQSSAIGGIPFPGAGNGGQSNLLLAGFTPNACLVSGPTTTFNGAPVQVGGADQVTWRRPPRPRRGGRRRRGATST